MAAWTSQRSGNWSVPSNDPSSPWYDGGTQTGRASIPQNNDSVTIASGHSVCFDVNQSGFTDGIAGLVIQGGATPGMLYFKYDADGTYWLKIKTGTTLSGTTSTNRGRLLANGTGTWGDSTALPFGRKAIIDLAGTAYIDASNLDIRLHATHPTRWYLTTYGTKYDFSYTAVDVANNTIDLGVTPPAAGTAIRIRTTGTLPGGLTDYEIYYVRAVSGTKCKLALQNNDATIVDITSQGTGTHTLYTGHTNTSTATINVFEDVTADQCWTTASGHNWVVLVDEGPENRDIQRVQLTAISSGSVTFSANIDSAQYPGAKVWLSSRNVSVRGGGISSTQSIVAYGSATHSGVFDCEIRSSMAGEYGYGIIGGTSHTVSGTIAGCFYGINGGTSHTVSGTITGCTYGINGGTSHTVSGTITGCTYGITGGTSHTVSGTIAGCNIGINGGTTHTVSGTIAGCGSGISGTSHTVSGTIAGCNNGIYNGTSCTVSGTIAGCNNGIRDGTSCTVSGTITGCGNGIYSGTHFINGATLSSNTADLRGVQYLVGYRASLNSAAQQYGTEYRLTVNEDWRTNVIYDIGGQPGRVKAWMPGGVIVTEAAPGSPPVSLPYAYKHTGEVSTRDVFLDFPITCEANQQLTIKIYEKCGSAPSTFTVGPRFLLVDPGYLYGNPASILVEKTAQSDGGDDTDWHTITMQYTPNETRTLILRARMRDASRSFWWMFSIEGGSSGGGSGIVPMTRIFSGM